MVWRSAPGGARTSLRCPAWGRRRRTRCAPLRELRSDNAGEHEDEGAPRRAPAPDRASQPPDKSLPPGSACRDSQQYWWAETFAGSCASAKPGPGGPRRTLARCLRLSDLAAARVSALRGLTRRHCPSGAPFGERSEFGDGPRDRTKAGASVRPAPTAEQVRRGLTGHGFAARCQPLCHALTPTLSRREREEEPSPALPCAERDNRRLARRVSSPTQHHQKVRHERSRPSL
jgi:hypothetical protein